MKASGSGPWVAVATVIYFATAWFLISQSAAADGPLQASLDYAILAQPYENSVHLNLTGADIRTAVDRDPSSPYRRTIYAVAGDEFTFSLQRSLDGGRTFDRRIVFDQLCRGHNLSCRLGRPDIAVGTFGALYIVDTIISTSEAKILRSMDQGLSWQSATSFDNFGVFVSIATDNQTGAVYVAGVDPSGTVLVTRSLDQGQTWNPPVNVSNGLTPAIPQVAALRSDVVAAFLSGNDSAAEVSVAVSHDGGLTWPTMNTVSPKTLCSAATPLVFDNRTRLHATWHSGECCPNGTFATSVYVGRSDNLGQTFDNASFRVTFQEGAGGNATSFEHLVAGLDDNIYLTWYDSRKPPAQFRSVSGEASGEVVSATPSRPGVEVDVELVDLAAATVRAQAVWRGTRLVFAELPSNVYTVWIRVGNESARAGKMTTAGRNSAPPIKPKRHHRTKYPVGCP